MICTHVKILYYLIVYYIWALFISHNTLAEYATRQASYFSKSSQAENQLIDHNRVISNITNSNVYTM